MKKRTVIEILLVNIVLVLLTLLFFHKTVFRGLVPFPGDVLVAEYQPWRSASYLGYNPGSYPHKAQYPDTIRQLYPWKTLTITIIKEGKLPLWNPYNFSGTPLLANFQTAAFYPFKIFYFLFSQIDAWTILVILQPILATLFTYFYARAIGISLLGGLLAGLSYGFSLFMTVWLEYNTVGHIILWLPITLLAIEKLAKKRTVLGMMALPLSLTAPLLAGHPQVAGYLFVFALIYLLYRVPTLEKKLKVGSLITFGVGLSAGQLIPGLELLINAARSPHDFTMLFEKILIQPWQLLMLAFPNFFGNPATRTYWPTDTYVGKVTSIGLIPLFFLPAALRCKEPLVKFYLVASAVVLLLITANPVTFLLYKIPMPLFSSSSPTLMVFILSFALSVLAAFGLDGWTREKHSIKKLAKRTFQVGAILFVLWLVTVKLPIFPELIKHGKISQRAILYAGVLSSFTLILFYLAIRFPKWKLAAICLLLALHTADLFISFQRFNPFVPREFVFPPHEVLSFLKESGIDRHWGYGTAAVSANFASHYQLFSSEGYDPLYPRWYGEFIHASRDGKLLTRFTNETRSDATIVPGFGEDGFTNPYRKRVLDALSVRYILDRTENGSTQKTFPPETFRTIYQKNDWRILENRYSAPRIFLTTNVATYKTRGEFEKRFFSLEFDPATSVLLPEWPPLTYPVDPAPAVELLSYVEDEIVVRTKSTSPAVLVVTDTYYPGWQATIDGKPTKIIRANWALRAVTVPAGDHLIAFRYQPLSFKIGVILSIMSVIALSMLIFASRQNKPTG